MTKALVPVTPDNWTMITSIAPTALKTRWFGLTESQARWCLLAGHELGFSLSGALEVIKPINNRPTLSPRGHLALLHDSGLFAPPGYIKVEDIEKDGKPHACRVSMKRNDTQFEYSVKWTIDNAQNAKLLKDGSGWDKHPANLLRWITIGFCADVVAPDIAGLKRTIEFGEIVDANGDAISTTWTVQEPKAVVTTTDVPDIEPSISIKTEPKYTTLQDLLKKWSADRIVAANEGRVPATAENCQNVAKKLEAEDATN